MPATMTYNSLVDDIQTYSEKTNTSFVDQIPRFVMMAENRIASEIKGLGFLTPVTGALVIGTPTMAKPAYWRAPVSFNITVNSERVELLPRDYEYCRNYWPNPSVTSVPRFYADYNYDNLLIVPTPIGAYAFELLYFARLQPLDATHQTNWITTNAPQLLLYACMTEAQAWLQNFDKIALWQGLYDRTMTSLNGEDQQRQQDRTTERTSA